MKIHDSFHDYYMQQSYGKLDIDATVTDWRTNDRGQRKRRYSDNLRMRGNITLSLQPGVYVVRLHSGTRRQIMKVVVE